MLCSSLRPCTAQLLSILLHGARASPLQAPAWPHLLTAFAMLPNPGVLWCSFSVVQSVSQLRAIIRGSLLRVGMCRMVSL